MLLISACDLVQRARIISAVEGVPLSDAIILFASCCSSLLTKEMEEKKRDSPRPRFDVTSSPRVLITGGAGFIGSEVLRHFVRTFPSMKLYVLDKLDYCASRKISRLKPRRTSSS